MIATLTAKDIAIPISCNQVLILDRSGYELYLKYGEGKNGWKYNYSVMHLHRREPFDSGCGVRFRTVLFYRELLGLRAGERVVFLNGDRLDLRPENLYITPYFNSVYNN